MSLSFRDNRGRIYVNVEQAASRLVHSSRLRLRLVEEIKNGREHTHVLLSQLKERCTSLVADHKVDASHLDALLAEIEQQQSKRAESKRAESKRAESKRAESKRAESKRAESKRAESKRARSPTLDSSSSSSYEEDDFSSSSSMIPVHPRDVMLGPEHPPPPVPEMDQISNAASTLCRVYETIGRHDDNLKQRIQLSLNHYERLVSPLFQQQRALNIVRMTDRIETLYPAEDYDRETLFRIGKDASERYEVIYGMPPPKMPQLVGGKARLVNVYTRETAPRTLDEAIHHEFND